MLGKPGAQGALDLLKFFHGEFGGVDATRDLRVEVATDETGESDAKHAPKSHARDIAELEGSVKRDDRGAAVPRTTRKSSQ